MSFDVNVLSSKPVIREAASMNNDGGGGNLGYMQQKKKDEKNEKRYLSDGSIFESKDEFDIFGFNKEIKIPDEKSAFAKFIEKIIGYFRV